MTRELVPIEIEKKLPQANRLFKFSHSKYWWQRLYKWVIRYTNQYGYVAPYPQTFFSIRGANFSTHYFGPFSITIKRRWLLLPARAYHKDVFND